MSLRGKGKESDAVNFQSKMGNHASTWYNCVVQKKVGKKMWLISRPKWVPTLVNLYCTARRLKDNWQGWVYTDREERERMWLSNFSQEDENHPTHPLLRTPYSENQKLWDRNTTLRLKLWLKSDKHEIMRHSKFALYTNLFHWISDFYKLFNQIQRRLVVFLFQSFFSSHCIVFIKIRKKVFPKWMEAL